MASDEETSFESEAHHLDSRIYDALKETTLEEAPGFPAGQSNSPAESESSTGGTSRPGFPNPEPPLRTNNPRKVLTFSTRKDLRGANFFTDFNDMLRLRSAVKAINQQDEAALLKLEESVKVVRGRHAAFAAVVHWMHAHKEAFKIAPKELLPDLSHHRDSRSAAEAALQPLQRRNSGGSSALVSSLKSASRHTPYDGTGANSSRKRSRRVPRKSSACGGPSGVLAPSRLSGGSGGSTERADPRKGAAAGSAGAEASAVDAAAANNKKATTTAAKSVKAATTSADEQHKAAAMSANRKRAPVAAAAAADEQQAVAAESAENGRAVAIVTSSLGANTGNAAGVLIDTMLVYVQNSLRGV